MHFVGMTFNLRTDYSEEFNSCLTLYDHDINLYKGSISKSHLTKQYCLNFCSICQPEISRMPVTNCTCYDNLAGNIIKHQKAHNFV